MLIYASSFLLNNWISVFESVYKGLTISYLQILEYQGKYWLGNHPLEEKPNPLAVWSFHDQEGNTMVSADVLEHNQGLVSWMIFPSQFNGTLVLL